MNNLRVIIISAALILLIWGVNLLQSRKSEALLLAHNMTNDHPVHQGMEMFAREAHEKSNGRIKVIIYPNGQLGSEKDVLSLAQIGAISMTKVSSLSIESFSPMIGIVNLPFLFQDQGHYHKVLDSQIGEELLAAPAEKRLRGLTYYEAGSRSFYANRPIRKPEDVRGLKIRVMDNPTAIRMMHLLGGSPTPMPYGEVYTALQQGVIDGAENNITALTVNRHGEVAKFYSLDEHIFAPDILIISDPVWRKLSEEDQKILKTAAEASKHYQRELWEKKTADYEEEAKKQMGVNFIYPERELFEEKVKSLHEEYGQRGDHFQRIITAIKEAAEESL